MQSQPCTPWGAEKWVQAAGPEGGGVELLPAKPHDHGLQHAEHLPSEGNCTPLVSE